MAARRASQVSRSRRNKASKDGKVFVVDAERRLLRRAPSEVDPKAHRPLAPWIEEQSPVRARKVYYQGSAKEAIKANCIECVGSIHEAKSCTCYGCPLWSFRPGTKQGSRPVPPNVPTKRALEKLAEFQGRRSGQGNSKALATARASRKVQGRKRKS